MSITTAAETAELFPPLRTTRFKKTQHTMVATTLISISIQQRERKPRNNHEKIKPLEIEKNASYEELTFG